MIASHHEKCSDITGNLGSDPGYGCLWFQGLSMWGKWAFLTALNTWRGSLSPKASYSKSTALNFLKLLRQIWENTCVFCCAQVFTYLSKVWELGWRLSAIKSIYAGQLLRSVNYYFTVVGAHNTGAGWLNTVQSKVTLTSCLWKHSKLL